MADPESGGSPPSPVSAGAANVQEEAFYHRLLDAAPDAIVVAARDGRMVVVNARAEALFGYARADLLGRQVEMLLPERYRRVHPGHRDGYFDDPASRPMGAGMALFGMRQDGTEFAAEINLSPLETETGLVAIAAIRDVTRRRGLEEERAKLDQAQEAIRMRDEFLSIASHELRTPLSSLQIQVEGILHLAARVDAEAVLPRLLGKARKIDAAVHRLARLIDVLLDVSRITGGRLELQKEEVDLAAIVCGVVDQVRQELPTGDQVQLRVPDGPVVGRWDPFRLEQIATNLLSNAVKYGQGRLIEMSVVDEVGQPVRLIVRDRGIGIAPEDQTRIFHRFERIVSGRSPGGFGMGLWIVREIVEAHGGTITVWSQPGAGSIFTVELPRNIPAANEAPRGILVIDDDAMIRASFQEALEDEGFEVMTAANGADGLDLLRAGWSPRLILLDRMMPVMDGPAFLVEQRRDPALRDIPVVLVSAAGSAASQAKALGAVACLEKPIQLKALIDLAQRYCS